MGAYQAGFLHYLGIYLRAYQARLGAARAPFEVVTGSSAGGINSFLAVLEGCRQEPASEPSESLYYRVWVNLGLFVDPARPQDSDWQVTTGLYDPRAVTDRSLFSSQPLQQIEDNARSWIAEHPPIADCDVALGLTATRLEPRSLKIGDSNGANQLSTPHAVERFGFRIRGKSGADADAGSGLDAWQFENLRPREREDRAGVAVAALDDDLRERYPELVGYGRLLEGVLDLVRATGAFPLAFAPVELTLGHEGASKSERNKSVEIIDGGTYDNHPIQFASRLRRWKDSAQSIDAPPLALVHSRPYEFIMLEPSIVAYEQPTRPKTRRSGALALGLGFASDFLATARSAALLEAADELPWLRAPREQVSGDYLSKIPARRQPVSGEHLGNFFAFFERDFRDFDFHVGIADARAFVAQHPVWSKTAIHQQAMAAANRGLEPPAIKLDQLLAKLDLNAAEKLALVEYLLLSEFAAPSGTQAQVNNNFAALALASHAFAREPKHDLETWVTALYQAGFRYQDLSALDAKLHPRFNTKLRRTVGSCKSPGWPNGCTADWTQVSALMRLVLGQLTDSFAAEQSRERKSARVVTALLRTGADYALDGLFGYRHDSLIIDLSMRGIGGMAGFHVEPGLSIAGHLGGQAVGYYMGVGIHPSIYRWTTIGDGSARTIYPMQLGVELMPLSLHVPVQQRRRDFATRRGAVQVELSAPLHADFLLAREDWALRWGVGLRLAVVVLRHLVFAADAKLRTDGCWGSDNQPWCAEPKRLSFPRGVRQKALDEDWLFGLSVGLRLRPLTKPTADAESRSAYHWHK